MAILKVSNKDGYEVEVRGQAGIGTDYQGSSLDRVINSIPKRCNVSELFAESKLGVPKDLAAPIIDALEWEEELTRRLFNSKLETG